MTNRIKQLRKENGLTLKELSREVGIPASTISQYENERRKIPGSAVKTLSTFFGVPEDYILGAWSKKEILELMSSSLLDNYERLIELDREFKKMYEDGPFQNSGLFGSMSLITEPTPWGYISKKGSLESRTAQERAIQKEILSNDYMALAFSIISLIYFDSAFGNSFLEHEGNSKANRYELANEKVNDLMSSLTKSVSQNTKKDFLKSYFQKRCFKSVLSSLVVRKLMAEKVIPETMALVLVNSIEGEILEIEIRVYRKKELNEIQLPDETESHSTDDIDDLLQENNLLHDRIDELQKENDRLKAELASKR